MIVAWYKTGTISLTNGSTTVSGAGTAWISNAAIGEALYAPDGKLYEITGVASNTSLIIAPPYLGSTTSAQPYTIVPSQSYLRDLAAQAANLVNNYATIANNAGVGKFGDGTLGTPGIRFSDDLDTGFFRSASNEVTFVAGGTAIFKYNLASGLSLTSGGALVGTTATQTLTNKTLTSPTITGTGAAAFGNLSYSGTLTGGTGVINIGSGQVYKDASGNVGIGTSSPVSQLHLVSASDSGMTIYKSAIGAANVRVVTQGGGSALAFGIDQSTGTTERMRIDSSGNVGIGTASPASKFHVAGSFRQTGATVPFEWTVNSGAADFYKLNAVGFADNLIVANSSGNVGIGTSSPTDKLEVVSASNFAARIRTTTSNTFLSFSDTGTTGLGPFVGSNGNSLVFGRGGVAEYARIDSSGNLLVGTTSGNGKLYVNSTVNTPTVRFDNTTNSFTNVNLFSVLIGTGTNTTACSHLNGFADGSNRILIYGNGNIQNQNNSYAGISDIKLKENIVDATPKLEKINQVRVVNYNLKDSPEQKLLGVVAQELELIFPGMVEETADKDIDGNDLGTTTKSVRYSVFVPMLIKAIQEQQAMITSLKAEFDAYKLSHP